MNKPFAEMTESEQTADRIARNRVIDERLAARPGKPKQISRKRRLLFTDKDGVSFTHADTFPVIARGSPAFPLKVTTLE